MSRSDPLGKAPPGLGKASPGFLPLAELAPAVQQDIRYAGRANFMGRPVPGYELPICWLRAEVAHALAAAHAEAAKQGLTFVVYDGYRPQRAVQAFWDWAQDAADQAMKAEYYPDIDKRDLFDLGYISKTSAHCAGAAVDLAFAGLDFGTPFDLFDARSATDHPAISATAKRNRQMLVALMRQHGFSNLPNEWWHFNYEGLSDAVPLDVPIA